MENKNYERQKIWTFVLRVRCVFTTLLEQTYAQIHVECYMLKDVNNVKTEFEMSKCGTLKGGVQECEKKVKSLVAPRKREANKAFGKNMNGDEIVNQKCSVKR